MRLTAIATLVSLALIACAPTVTQDSAPVPQAQQAPTLSNRDWQLHQVDGHALDPALVAAITQPVSLRIDQQHIDGTGAKLSGFDGCNRYFAAVEIDADQLRVGAIGASKMYCEASSAFAQDFQQRLRQVSQYQIESSELQLLDASGQLLLSFRQP